MRMLSDAEIYELVDHMDGDGGVAHFTTSREEVKRVIVDAIERELAAHNSAHDIIDGVCTHFGDQPGAIHFEVDGVGYHLLPGGSVDTPRGRVDYCELVDAEVKEDGATEEDLIWTDVYDGKRLGNEARDIAEAITQLREGLLADAEYENRNVRQVLREHPLYLKLSARLAEIRAELVSKV